MGADYGARWQAGDLVLLQGELGVGKTTFVRGLLEGLGYRGPVRSPTFNLMQSFPTQPPVIHLDLYRAPRGERLDVVDQLDSHLALVEWGRSDLPWIDAARTWTVAIEWEGEGRRITINPPLET